MGITINLNLIFERMKMKTILFSSALMLILSGAVLTSCGNQEQSETPEAQADTHEHAATFACPMKCEGEKTYSEEGKCPSCGMALEEVAHNHDHGDHEH